MSKVRSRFGPELRAKILARVEIGVTYVDAATAAGVNPATAKSWLARGRRERSGAYFDFAAAVEQAREAARSRPAPMSEDEFQQRLDGAVRAGSTQAMKLWDERNRRDREPEVEPEQPSKIASLSERRRQKAAG